MHYYMKIRINKIWSVVGAFCALTMNVNAKYVDFSELCKELWNIREELKPLGRRCKHFRECMSSVIEKICPVDPQDGELLLDTYLLLCLGVNECELANLNAEERKALIKRIERTELESKRPRLTRKKGEDSYLWNPSGKTYQLLVAPGIRLRLLAILLKRTNYITEVSCMPICGEIANGVSDLFKALKVNQSLTSLMLDDSFCIFGDDEVGLLSEVLKSNRSLAALGLSGLDITDDRLKLISDALKHNDTLTELHLGGVHIGASGASSVSDALTVNSSLVQLKLSLANAGDAGVSSFSDALKVNSSLTKLDLYFKHIGDAGVSSFSDALKVNSSLTELGLFFYAGSPADSESRIRRALCSALESNSTITQLNP